MYQEDTVML